MEKCKWEDGKFVPCENFNWHIIEYNLASGEKAKKCYHCKADIRKPEPEPKPSITRPIDLKIVRSGIHGKASLYIDGGKVAEQLCFKGYVDANLTFIKVFTDFYNNTLEEFFKED